MLVGRWYFFLSTIEDHRYCGIKMKCPNKKYLHILDTNLYSRKQQQRLIRISYLRDSDKSVRRRQCDQ